MNGKKNRNKTENKRKEQHFRKNGQKHDEKCGARTTIWKEAGQKKNKNKDND